MTTILLFVGVMMNGNFNGFIFEQYRNTMNVVTVFVLVWGLNQRIYGFENIQEDMSEMISNSLALLIVVPMFMYCNVALTNISKK